MRLIILTTVLIFLCEIAEAKNFKIGLQTGYGTYNMSDFKKLVTDYYSKLPFNSSLSENFPPYIYYQVNTEFGFKKVWSIGPSFSIHSTGSRISKKDYTGFFYSDYTVKNISISLKTTYFLKQNKSVKIYLFNESGTIFGKLNTQTELKIENYPNYNSYVSDDLSNIELYIEPGAEFLVPVSRNELGLSVSYCLPITNWGYFLAENKKMKLYKDGLNLVNNGWSGFRIGVCFYLHL